MPGDRLWVRETWCPGDWWTSGVAHDPPEDIRYAADNSAISYATGAPLPIDTSGWSDPKRWRPSIFMPRWASRITLDVVSVRVERLHAITTEEILREGARIPLGEGDVPVVRLTGKYPPTHYLPCGRGMRWTAEELLRAEFASLWDTINGKRAAWLSNPWVWRVEFARAEAPRA